MKSKLKIFFIATIVACSAASLNQSTFAGFNKKKPSTGLNEENIKTSTKNETVNLEGPVNSIITAIDKEIKILSMEKDELEKLLSTKEKYDKIIEKINSKNTQTANVSNKNNEKFKQFISKKEEIEKLLGDDAKKIDQLKNIENEFEQAVKLEEILQNVNDPNKKTLLINRYETNKAVSNVINSINELENTRKNEKSYRERIESIKKELEKLYGEKKQALNSIQTIPKDYYLIDSEPSAECIPVYVDENVEEEKRIQIFKQQTEYLEKQTKLLKEKNEKEGKKLSQNEEVSIHHLVQGYVEEIERQIEIKRKLEEMNYQKNLLEEIERQIERERKPEEMNYQKNIERYIERSIERSRKESLKLETHIPKLINFFIEKRKYDKGKIKLEDEEKLPENEKKLIKYYVEEIKHQIEIELKLEKYSKECEEEKKHLSEENLEEFSLSEEEEKRIQIFKQQTEYLEKQTKLLKEKNEKEGKKLSQNEEVSIHNHVQKYVEEMKHQIERERQIEIKRKLEEINYQKNTERNSLKLETHIQKLINFFIEKRKYDKGKIKLEDEEKLPENEKKLIKYYVEEIEHQLEREHKPEKYSEEERDLWEKLIEYTKEKIKPWAKIITPPKTDADA